MKTATVFAVFGLLASTLACGPDRPDHDSTAEAALNRAGLEHLSADYDQQANVVHLSGTVATESDRERAADVVRQAVNPARVANEVTVEGVDSKTADDLDSGLSTRLDNLIDRDAALANASIDFEVKNGVVTITGQVPTAEQKNRVEELARSQPGVKDVVNSLEVKSS
jgi:hyperosmotically inducible protein